MAAIDYDEQAQVAYFKLENAPIATSKIVSDDVWVDYGHGGNIVGIQIFYPLAVLEEKVQSDPSFKPLLEWFQKFPAKAELERVLQHS